MEKIIISILKKKELIFLEKNIISFVNVETGHRPWMVIICTKYNFGSGAPRTFMSHHAKCGAQHFVVRANP
jgi:hypothetical protein